MRPVHVHTLKNTIRIVYHPGVSEETSAVGVWINTGARYESIPVKGIAHYLEHLLFKGSAHYSYKKLKQEIEGRGGLLNGFTSQEMTCYYAKVLNKNLLKTVDILLDMVFSPLLKEEDIQKERNVILEEVKMQNDLPQSRSEMLLDELLWGDTPLGCDVIGTVETIKSIRQDDLRRFLRTQYIPGQILISVCSKISFASVQRAVMARGSRQKPSSSSIAAPMVSSSLRPGVHSRIEGKDLHQTHLVLGFKGMRRTDPSLWVLKLMHVVLGGNMSSRLFEKIREERGLAYDVSSAHRSFHDSGCFSIHTGLAPENVPLTIEIVFKELRRLQKSLIPRDEFQRAKDYLWGQHIMAFERTMDIMLFMGESMLGQGYVPTRQEIKDRIASVTADDVRRLARDIFSPELTKLSLVGKVNGTIRKDTENILRKVTSHG